MSLFTTIEPFTKKYKGLPSGGWIEYFTQTIMVKEGYHLFHTNVNYRVHFSVTGKILSQVSSNGFWNERRYDDQDRIVYYENTRMIKTFQYHIDEFGVEQRTFNLIRK